MKEISVRSWKRYLTPELGVETELMGSKHEFTFEGFEVKVILPSKEEVCAKEGYEVRAKAWHVGKPDDPFEFDIINVDLEVNIKDRISVPENATDSMRVNICDFEVDRVNKKKISDIAEKYSEISDRAFQYWLDILRWSTNYPFLGKQKQSQPNSSGYGIYLQDIATGNSVFNLHNAIDISLLPVVTVPQWKLTQEKLAINSGLPMYMKFKFDAHESMRIGNYEQTILELALANEIYVKKSFSDYLSKNNYTMKLLNILKRQVSVII